MAEKSGSADSSSIFFFLAAIWILLSALISSFAPIAFSIGTVFLFAAPHNWIELRYFFSKLPSRFGPLRAFFCSSFAGVATLGLLYAALIILTRRELLSYDASITSFQAWIFLFYGWLATLLLLRRDFSRVSPGENEQHNRAIKKDLKRRNFGLILLSVCAAASLLKPLEFGICLTYLHPLIALCVLDRELRRSRPKWILAYRGLLLFAAALVVAMITGLSGTASLAAQTPLDSQIARHAGSYLLSNVSSHLLVSLHTFLENLHYGVWLLAIPFAARLFERGKTQTHVMPFSRASKSRQSAVKAVFAFSTLVVFCFWFAFLGNYSASREFYFVIAVFHILAELPFLLWIL